MALQNEDYEVKRKIRFEISELMIHLTTDIDILINLVLEGFRMEP